MRRFGLSLCLLTLIGVGSARGAAPAAPTYQTIAEKIHGIRAEWDKPNAPSEPNAPGWNALFDALLADLRAYSSATSENERLKALDKIYKISNALASAPWAPATELREVVREWLRPRVRLARAERRLVDHVQALPPAPSPGVQGNREKWVKFVNDDLGESLRKYDGASTVAQRQDSLKSVYAALNALQSKNQSVAWNPSLELQAALNDLYNQPNLDISVDVNTLSPLFNVNLITDGPVSRKGYVSQVTAGPKTGFGLLPSDDGIFFYNKQLMNSVTPIWDFQQQVQNNPQGKRAAKMYQFNATSTDASELTIYTVIRPSGLTIYPGYKHNVGADINTTPQPRGGLQRGIASLLGFNQSRITQMAWQNAIGPMAANVETEAMEVGKERTASEAAQRNVTLSQYLVGGNRAVYQNIQVDGLSLRSRPENALIGGKLSFRSAGDQIGAYAPQPLSMLRPEWGVSADLHLVSILSNFIRGYYQNEQIQGVENVLLVTRKVEPGSPPGAAFKVSKNVDYPTLLKAIQDAQAANDPKIVALRVKRPTSEPEFAADAKGNLVAIINDFQIEVPAPPQAGRGGVAAAPAKVYRIVAPQVEVAIELKIDGDVERQPLRLKGKVVGFDAGAGFKIYALGDDEKQSTTLTTFTSTIVMGVIRAKILGQPIDLPLSDLQLRGFAIRSVSPLDPSGWIRVNLVRTSNSPAAGIQ